MSNLIATLDWKNPDYNPFFQQRLERLAKLRANPEMLPDLKRYYAQNIPTFINDFGTTLDTRVATPKKGRDPVMPFILMPKQVELVEWFVERINNEEPGVLVKSRDVGASWLAFATAVSLCLFNKSVSFGFGSATEDKLDRSGDPDCLFYKGRMFLEYLPKEFRGGWDPDVNSAHMRLSFPETGASITGEAGHRIGRGGRKLAYFLDESAFLEQPLKVDASLLATTNSQIHMSSVNGSANPFAQKAMGGKISRFDFRWSDDLRKDQAWFDRKKAETDNDVIFAQEYLCSFTSGMDQMVIEPEWVEAAVDAHVKLGLEISGIRFGGLDVADGGADKNAFTARHGILCFHAEEWSGKGSDLYATAERAFALCDKLELPGFQYDGDGMGVSFKGDSRKINEAREERNQKRLSVDIYRGSDAVSQPDRKLKGSDKTNKDAFTNAKAQNWWHMRRLFSNTFRAIQGLPYDPNELISISSKMKDYGKLVLELSQPQWSQNSTGKILIDKVPDGSPSPNLADSLVICYAPRKLRVVVSDLALLATGGTGD